MNNDNLILQLVGQWSTPPALNDRYLTIAELRTEETNHGVRTIDINTALISESLINKIKPNHCTPFVRNNSQQQQKEGRRHLDFWLGISPANGLKQAEPLAIAWTTGNHTTMQPDQGFLATMGLTPRVLQDEIRWHDLSRPKYDIVINKPLAIFDFPNYTSSLVSIDREYLEDYLRGRQKIAIQIFTISEDVTLTADITRLLNGKDHFVEVFKTFEIRLKKHFGKEEIIHLELNGYRRLLPPQNTVEDQEVPSGHHWKGIIGLVDFYRARFKMPFEYAYVSDEVLEVYENDEAYQVFPEFGSVKYGTHWSVSYCERVGRNAIKIELKKLYEGTPYEVIDHWNKFSIDPVGIDKTVEHIEIKARRLIRYYFLFDRLMVGLFNKITNDTYISGDVVNIDQDRMEYTGWQEFPIYEAIANHVPVSGFSKEKFLIRCKKLYILLIEHLAEKKIRKVVMALGFSKAETSEYRSLKLIELILKYATVMDESGLDPIEDQAAILARIAELKEYEPIPELFALTAIRQLDSHNSPDNKAKLQTALKTFGINSNSLSNNYADALDQVYDRLAARFSEINSWLSNF